MAKKSGLGRGLSDIFVDVEDAYSKAFEVDTSIVKDIDISLIVPNPYQPRKHFNIEALNELSQSIKTHGLIQPIIVVLKDGGYMLIAGERRLRATKLLGHEKISAIVAKLESKNLRELALIENIQRENLNPIELANSYKELIHEYNITQEALADVVHKSRTQITNTMRLLALCDYVQDLLQSQKITQGHAKVIVGLDEQSQKLVADTVIGQKLNVRETEELIKKIKNESTKILKEPQKQFEHKLELLELQKAFERLNIKTKIKDKKITLEFNELAQIQNFINLLQ